MSTSYANLADASTSLKLARNPQESMRHECDEHFGVCPVADLRAALAREAALLRERDALIERQATLSRESDHRFLNNLQMVSSLLSRWRPHLRWRMRRIACPPLGAFTAIFIPTMG